MQTEVLFFFDAEDYTSDFPNDALRDLANLFAGEGFTAHVAVVGYLAHEIARYNRRDVVEALSRFNVTHVEVNALAEIENITTSKKRATRGSFSARSSVFT